MLSKYYRKQACSNLLRQYKWTLQYRNLWSKKHLYVPPVRTRSGHSLYLATTWSCLAAIAIDVNLVYHNPSQPINPSVPNTLRNLLPLLYSYNVPIITPSPSSRTPSPSAHTPAAALSTSAHNPHSLDSRHSAPPACSSRLSGSSPQIVSDSIARTLSRNASGRRPGRVV